MSSWNSVLFYLTLALIPLSGSSQDAPYLDDWRPSLELNTDEQAPLEDADYSLKDEYNFSKDLNETELYKLDDQLPQIPTPSRSSNPSVLHPEISRPTNLPSSQTSSGTTGATTAPTTPTTPTTVIIPKSATTLVPAGGTGPQAAPTTVIIPNAQPATSATPSPLITPNPTTIMGSGPVEDPTKEILINFNNVSVVEFLRFISRASNKNFLFDDADLQFNVTIVSEEPTSLTNILTALMQVLRVHDLSLMEQGNNIIIHRNKAINQISQVVDEHNAESAAALHLSELVTRVFRLNTLDAEKASVIILPLISEGALIEVLPDTNNLVVTDLATNVEKIGQLIRSLDAPNSGLTVGQYVVINGLIDSLISLAEKIMEPMADGKPLVFVAHTPTNSIFVVSTPFMVDRAMGVLRTLDITQGKTKIFGPDDLKFKDEPPEGPRRGASSLDRLPGETEEEYRARVLEQERLQQERAERGEEPFPQGSLESTSPWTADLPSGHIERTRFYIYKLRYRKGDEIVDALGRIGFSLQETGSGNMDLIASIQSIQWLESSNSLVFTGTSTSIAKVKELVEEIDTPLRQVFIEMLILETTLDDSLEYGVNFGSRFNNGDTAGSQAFLSGANTLSAALDNTVVGTVLDPSGLARNTGYHLGIIGRTVSHCGTEFGSIGALVTAVHDKSKTDILMNPKILVEDNATAEIFVGINTAFKTQSVANDRGEIITNNFEFRDVGTTLRVTPLISNNDMITLEIKEEVSSVVDFNQSTGTLDNQPVGPTTRQNRTTTKVHVPNKFFLVMSGMIQDEFVRRRQQVPCLGGAPLIGALFSDKQLRDAKRNLMIFIRPQIVDSVKEIDDLTRHQQDIYREKARTKKMWKYEVEEALDLLNIKEPDVSLHDTEQYNP